MSKSDNLTDFLTDIADAIREKKGISNKINPQNFSAEIRSIEGGGSSGGGGDVNPSAQAGDVNFIDYNGTILHSFGKDDFLGLSDMPELPSKEGLICQGWNYTISDAKNYVSKYGALDIGATYITDDGKTRLYIKINSPGRMTIPLYFSQTVANGVTIDWGDGSATQTLNDTGNVITSHTYAEIGEYIISLDATSGCTLGLGHQLDGYCVMGSTANDGKVYLAMLRKVEIGKNVTSINDYAFLQCRTFKSVTIPNSVLSIGANAFKSCNAITNVVIPNSVTSIGDSAINSCYNISIISIPNSVTSIGKTALGYCYSLTRVVIPDSITSISDYLFYYCYILSSLTIPDSVTSVGEYAFAYCNAISSIVIPEGLTQIRPCTFQSCYSLARVVIPNSVTSIINYAFRYCYALPSIAMPSGLTKLSVETFDKCLGMAYYDFRQCKSIPTINSSSVFNEIPSDCKIVVPDNLYNSWKSATNWSSLASKIVKASEFNG